jgi:hypothetical protein
MQWTAYALPCQRGYWLMIRLFWTFSVACVLSGCGLAHQIQFQQRVAEAQKINAAEAAECKARHPEPNQKPVTPWIKCLNATNYKFASQVGDPNIDLLRLASAQMVALGERYDSGQLTEAQYDVEKATIGASYNSQLLQRRNSTLMANAAVDQASAAQQQAAATTAAAINSSTPKTTTCNRLGNTVTCY